MACAVIEGVVDAQVLDGLPMERNSLAEIIIAAIVASAARVFNPAIEVREDPRDLDAYVVSGGQIDARELTHVAVVAGVA